MMRVWGRVKVPGGLQWVEVTTDAKGFNDYVYITALIQCLKLSIGESPFWANWGIPAQRSVMQQVAPDYYAALMQQRFAPHFASLKITRVTAAFQPTYQVDIITNQGVVVQQEIAV